MKEVPEAFGEAWGGLSGEAPGAIANAGDDLHDMWQEGDAHARTALVVAFGTTAGPILVFTGYYGIPVAYNSYISAYVWGCENYLASSHIASATASAIAPGPPNPGWGYAGAFSRWAYNLFAK